MTQATSRLRIGAEQAGRRLDKILANALGLSRRHVRDLFRAQCVRVEGRLRPASYLAHLGENVAILPLPAAAVKLGAPLRVVQQTADWVIVDKPAGQPTVALRQRQGDSLAEALERQFPELAELGYRKGEAGLLHRLDTHTSGLLLAARNAEAFNHLRSLLKQGLIEKRYYAIVRSRPDLDACTIELPVKPRPGSSRRVMVCAYDDPRGQPASTQLRVVSRHRHWTLLDVSVAHAYRHQIRVHLSHAGHPLAGDTLYGGEPVTLLGERHALHAHFIAWSGDTQIAAFSADSPLPTEFSGMLACE